MGQVQSIGSKRDGEVLGAFRLDRIIDGLDPFRVWTRAGAGPPATRPDRRTASNLVVTEVECAPAGGQDQAAVLTVSRAC